MAFYGISLRQNLRQDACLRKLAAGKIGMATFRVRGEKVRAEICVNGQRESKTFAKNQRTRAKVWAAKRETELRSGKVSTSNISFRDVLRRYLDEVSPQKRGGDWEKRRISKLLKEPWTDVRLSRCTTDYLVSWRDNRLKDTYRGKTISPATVRRDMTLLSHVFTIARREWRLLASNPMSDMQKPRDSQHRERLFSDDELSRLCEIMGYSEACDLSLVSQRVAAAMLLAIETAMRAGELCSLSPRTVFLHQRYVHLDKTKNGSSRDVPLSSRAVELLSRLDCDLRLTPAQIDANFRKYRDKLGIQNLHFHDTRHTAITRIANSRKLDVLELARMTGHKRISQLQAYYNETAENIAKRLD